MRLSDPDRPTFFASDRSECSVHSPKAFGPPLELTVTLLAQSSNEPRADDLLESMAMGEIYL